MIIPSPLIILDYNPVKDILFVEWPDMHNSHLTEVQHSLQEIVSTIVFYDVKKLLIDSRKTVPLQNKQECARIVADFTKDLMNTRLQRVAHLENTSKDRAPLFNEATQQKLPIDFQNFSSKSDAQKWLEVY